MVDQRDLDAVILNWGATGDLPSADLASIPEPASVCLLACSVLLVGFTRWCT
jgi:hypothetical protein